MTVTIFDRSGIYVPVVNGTSETTFVRTDEHDPLVGVNVDSAQNASTFSDVLQLDDEGRCVEFWPKQSK